VLVVDDSEDGGLLAQGLLTRLGHHVEVIREGSAAIAAIDRGAFDVVLMDVHMPSKDGLSVTREIRGREALKGAARVPILFVTANTLNETRIQAAAAGGNGLITKPITAAQLIAGIDAAIGRTNSPASEAASWATVSEEEHSQVLPTPSEVDNVIEPLLPRYLAARRSDVDVIKEATNRRDAEVIKTLGHNMKGSGTSYGLPQVSAIGDTLEKAAGEAAWERVARAITDLERALDRLEYTLEERVTPMSLM
jgi:CheY-like chemotaxis protein/HPt (histidine-containing phosphotransfer) domain-containing protein